MDANIKIIRSHRASIVMHMSPNGELVIKVPHLVPKFIIDRFISEKSEWIQKTRLRLAKIKPVKREYIEGEQFYYLGKPYELLFNNDSKISLHAEKLHFPKAIAFRVKKEIDSWYLTQAKDLISQRVKDLSQRMGADYKSIFFSDTRSKWGTCFEDNSLQFSWRLIMAPLPVIDYVVIHELTHTKHKNHSSTFWSQVRLFTPAYRQHRKWLEDHMGIFAM